MINKKKNLNKANKGRKVGIIALIIPSILIIYLLLFLLTLGRIIFSGQKAEPISLKITASPINELRPIKLLRISPRDKICNVPQHLWNGYTENFKKIWLAVPKNIINKITTVEISIGPQFYSFTNKEFMHRWRKIPNGILPLEIRSDNSRYLIYEAPGTVSLKKSSLPLPYINSIINWPGDVGLLQYSNTFGLFGSIILIILFFIIVIIIRSFIPKRFSMNRYEQTVTKLNAEDQEKFQLYYSKDDDGYVLKEDLSIKQHLQLYGIIKNIIYDEEYYFNKNTIRGRITVNSIIVSPVAGSLIIALPLIFLSAFMIISGYGPVHDAMNWHGVSHYFYTSVADGRFPYWNPYSQAGTPFYNYFQTLGLLEPSNFIFIFIQKITGCTTFTSYILHYLFLMYIFILGTYFTLRFLLRDNRLSLVFSIILLLSVFPNFMRQNGALNTFVLAPFLTYFIFKFFTVNNNCKKGVYLFCNAVLIAISLHIYIVVGIIYYIIVLMVLFFILRIFSIKKVVHYIFSREGLRWFSISFIVFLLISAPVLAMYFDFNYHNEIFPNVRVILNNGFNLVKVFASNITESFFSDKFLNNHRVSIKPGNLIGLITEPNAIGLFGVSFKKSEILLYVGILPLIFFFRGLIKTKNKTRWAFFIITVITLLVMTSWDIKTGPTTTKSISQNIIFMIIPFLKAYNTYQNFGILFLFTIIISAAISFKNNTRFSLYLFITLYTCLIIKITWELFSYSNIKNSSQILIQVLIQILILLIIQLILLLLLASFSQKIISIKNLTILFMVFDIFIFSFISSINYPDFININNYYYEYLKKLDLYSKKERSGFDEYRLITTFDKNCYVSIDSSEDEIFKHSRTFWGNEVYRQKSVPFPALYIFKLFNTSIDGDYNHLPYMDHFYTTVWYYDYLVNVSPERQLVLSSVISPILNYYPLKRVIFVDNKYEAVQAINKLNVDDLENYIFIEKNPGFHKTDVEVKHLFDSKHVLHFSEKDLTNFKKTMRKRYLGNNKYIKVLDFDVNFLTAEIDAPGDGYFYFSDGFSKHWKAFVDGKKTKIEKTNINFKSVYVAKGKHTIKFRYDPVIFRFSLYLYISGMVLSIIVLAGIAIYKFIPWRRRYHG
ncbi:MAG: hypothetical protein A2W19_05330 [Spirochaetes bacterium RBG_16_49_21]|nr:MAG: hypothetical protein A2W19_05330 [Spirochaetes bacterium RBG_16_49_21]